MHSILRWAAENLSWMAAGAFTASLISVVFSIVQVRRKLDSQRQRMGQEQAVVFQELRLALSDDASQNWADGAEARQKVSDEPRKHGEVLAPAGQKGVRHGVPLRPTHSRLGSAG